jgi:hypothetical protein
VSSIATRAIVPEGDAVTLGAGMPALDCLEVLEVTGGDCLEQPEPVRGGTIAPPRGASGLPSGSRAARRCTASRRSPGGGAARGERLDVERVAARPAVQLGRIDAVRPGQALDRTRRGGLSDPGHRLARGLAEREP